ncbi:MAG: hypothetical protein EAZ20_02375 [Bacteroidetes bacterium]|nr:MAG: hypothetical protein EAZ20_02375 [Bacteroidota bacterium]
MAQYKVFAPDVQVNGQTILSFVNALPTFKDDLNGILKNYSLVDIKPDFWYSQESWLNAFKEIGEEFGEKTLFLIGKTIPESADFPPHIIDLQSALASIDMAYHMNHKGGEIGYYKLVDFDINAQKAIMECKNPYPSHFDRGIITAMARKFKPENVIFLSIELDTSKPSRLNGDDSCTFNISWSS